MGANTTNARLPALPAPEFFTVPGHTILTDDGVNLLSYDPATLAGFIYNIPAERWTITAPVDFETFAGVLALSGFRITATDDSRRWMAACGAAPAPGRKH